MFNDDLSSYFFHSFLESCIFPVQNLYVNIPQSVLCPSIVCELRSPGLRSWLSTLLWEAVGHDWEHCQMVQRIHEELISLTNTPSPEETFNWGGFLHNPSWSHQGSFHGSKALGWMRSTYLKSLDVVKLSWPTWLFSIAWRLETMPLDWQTRVVVPLFR